MVELHGVLVLTICLLHALQTSSGLSWELFKNAKVSYRYPLTGLAKRSWTCLKTWEQNCTPCFVNLVSFYTLFDVVYVQWFGLLCSEFFFTDLFTPIFLAGFNAVPGLSTLDYVTVAVIEKYLDFKVRKALPQTSRSRCECRVTIQIEVSKVRSRYCKRSVPS